MQPTIVDSLKYREFKNRMYLQSFQRWVSDEIDKYFDFY